MCKATAKTLIQLRFKLKTTGTGRGTDILFTPGENGIQFLTIGSGNIFHIRNILQPSFNLQRGDSGIQQRLQFLALVKVFQRK